jgi:hypothetical protein
LGFDRGPTAASDRFTALQVDGVWNVWDAERELYVVHAKDWDEAAAVVVVESLSANPRYTSAWDWSDRPAEVA